MNRKKRDTSQKRESIVKAAISVFSRDGYERSSMDRISQEAGASKRTVYNHFPSKEELLQEILKRNLEDQSLLKKIEYQKDKSLEEQLDLFIEGELFLVNEPTRLGMAKVLTSLFMYNPELAMKTRKKHRETQEPLIRWLEAASKDGRLQIPDVPMAARLFYSMVEGALTWPALFTVEMEFEKLIPSREELILTFLCRYEKR